MLEQTGEAMFTQPVELRLRAEFQIPASWSAKKKNAALAGVYRHGSKPDVDNIVKQVKDALKGIVYQDDALVCELHASKHYSNQPKLVILVSAL